MLELPLQAVLVFFVLFTFLLFSLRTRDGFMSLNDTSSLPAPDEPGLGDNQTVTLLFWLAFPFSVAAVVLSALGVYGHITQFYQPQRQRFIVRILCMVPVYCVASQVGIGFPWVARYLELLRDCYEAFVIYVFFMLLVEYIGGEDSVPRVFNARRLPEPGGEKELDNAAAAPADADEPPLLPGQQPPKKGASWTVTLGRLLFFWRPEHVDEDPRSLFLSIKRGILQFVVLMPIISVLTIISDVFSKLGEGDFSPDKSYVWLTVLHMISVTVAMIYLVRFYNIASHELKPHRPLPKFLCIKAVVFLSFYQDIMLAIVFATIDESHLDYTSATLQNFMICIEMFLAAIAHVIYFSPKEFKLQQIPSSPTNESLVDGEAGLGDLEGDAEAGTGMMRTMLHKLSAQQAMLASFLCVDVYKDTVRTFRARGQLVEPLMPPTTSSAVWKHEEEEEAQMEEAIWTSEEKPAEAGPASS